LTTSNISPFQFGSEFDRYGYINNQGDIIIQPTFTKADYFHENMAMVEKKLVGGYGYINNRGCLQIDYSRSHGPSIDPDLTFSDLESGIHVFSHGLAAFEDKENDRYGFINTQGKVSISAQYDYVLPFSEGLAAVSSRGKWGYINTKGILVIPMVFTQANSFTHGRASVQTSLSGQWKAYFIDPHGRALYNKTYKYASSYREGIASVQEENSEFAKCIDLNGRSISPSDFDCMYLFHDGLAFRIEVKEGRSYINYVNRSFQNISDLLIPTHKDVNARFSEGLINIPFNNKWGYMDKNGKLAIPAIFSRATGFRNGLARVNWVDSKGRSRNGFINHQRQIFYYEKLHLFSSEYRKKVCRISPDNSQIICDD
jgi:hypothetical protein